MSSREGDHEERLRAMTADGSLTWDLSPNDRAAIGWALAEVERLRAEAVALRLACEDKNRHLDGYRKAADEDRAEAGRLARERDAAIAEVALWASRAGRLGAALGGLLDRVESDELTADWLRDEVAAARRLLAAGPGATGEGEGEGDGQR